MKHDNEPQGRNDFAVPDQKPLRHIIYDGKPRCEKYQAIDD